jgi:excisionase family DNA binding protein
MEQLNITVIPVKELLEKISEIIDKKFGEFEKPAQKSGSKFMTRTEVSRHLKISLPTLLDWTKLGWLNSYKMGRRVLYKEEEVEQAVRNAADLQKKRAIRRLSSV